MYLLFTDLSITSHLKTSHANKRNPLGRLPLNIPTGRLKVTCGDLWVSQPACSGDGERSSGVPRAHRVSEQPHRVWCTALTSARHTSAGVTTQHPGQSPPPPQSQTAGHAEPRRATKQHTAPCSERRRVPTLRAAAHLPAGGPGTSAGLQRVNSLRAEFEITPLHTSGTSDQTIRLVAFSESYHASPPFK